MHFEKTIKQYRLILAEKLCHCQGQPQERRALIEVVMILLIGILYGLPRGVSFSTPQGEYNPHQVARELGIAPKQLYGQLHSLSARAWRRWVGWMMTQAAVERLKVFQARSAATQSRWQASLSIDDTVRLGKVLSYVWSWYSCQAKKTLEGQDLVGIVLCINGEILPVIWVSKPAVVLVAGAEGRVCPSWGGLDRAGG
jgi:hypothetical protein